MACFFFQAEDGIRDLIVTGSSDVCSSDLESAADEGRVAPDRHRGGAGRVADVRLVEQQAGIDVPGAQRGLQPREASGPEAGGGIGRAAWRGRGEISGVAGSFKKKKER